MQAFANFYKNVKSRKLADATGIKVENKKKLLFNTVHMKKYRNDDCLLLFCFEKLLLSILFPVHHLLCISDQLSQLRKEKPFQFWAIARKVYNNSVGTWNEIWKLCALLPKFEIKQTNRCKYNGKSKNKTKMLFNSAQIKKYKNDASLLLLLEKAFYG